ncbi:MAG: GNAT family N-acetyltransferase [Victivallaceae bacterium]
MEIREYHENDLAAVEEITRAAWKGVTIAESLEVRHGELGGKPAIEWKVEQVSRACREKPDALFVAEADGCVAGYAFFSVDLRRSVGEVCNNAVHPDFQGRGIGSAMNRHILAHFRSLGLKFAQVTTLEHDLPAQRVYLKNGFRELVRSIHYSMEL